MAGDEVYGQSPGLRGELEARQVGYVFAVAASDRVALGIGARRADQVAAALPRQAWQKLSAGAGAKGQRFCDWALVDIAPITDRTADRTADGERSGCRWLLIRRNRRTGELVVYRCYSPRPVPLSILVKVAGRRWTIEEASRAGKGLCGLGQHHVRTWRSWYRWTTLAMLAHAFLTAVAVSEYTHRRTEPGLIPLTFAQTRRLLARLTSTPQPPTPPRRRWSHWCRSHQVNAPLLPLPAPSAQRR